MLQVRDLSFSYGRRTILSQIEFTLNQGELTCLLGKNGSGKTTILKCLNGILQVEKGTITLHQIQLNKLHQREIARLIAMVPQEHKTVFSFQVLDIILMGSTPHLRFGRMPSEEEYGKAEEIMEMLGILHLKKRIYNQLSGGEKQLVLIGRALMQRTDYLLFDEPTSHLDFKNQHLLMREIKQMTKKGKGILMALHDPNLALKYCDQAILIKEGRILDRGEVKESITISNLKKTYDLDVVMETISGDGRVALPKL